MKSHQSRLANFFLFMIICWVLLPNSFAVAAEEFDTHSVYTLVGEKLSYDISFLWFDHLAEGSIELQNGPKPGTFLVVMQARTLGVAAFFTGNRVEKYQTLLFVGDDGLLHPLWHSSHTLRDRAKGRSEKLTRYDFDYAAGQVHYKKSKNGNDYSQKSYEMDREKPLYDILSALYNLRLGLYGPVGEKTILIPTFHRKGTQDIVVEPLNRAKGADDDFFTGVPVQVRILVDPEVFGTKGREILAGFDADSKPVRGIIKDVIGLGDVRGIYLNK